MSKERKSINKVAIVLGIIAIISFASFLLFDVSYVNGIYDTGIKGFNSIFGISQTISGTGGKFSLKFTTVNGIGITLLLLFLLSAILSGWFSNYGKGYYIAAIIVDLIIIILTFTYCSSWVKLNISSSKVLNNLNVGFGQITSGVLMCIHLIGCGVGYKLAGTNKR